jgi:hypothetical protein
MTGQGKVTDILTFIIKKNVNSMSENIVFTQLYASLFPPNVQLFKNIHQLE